MQKDMRKKNASNKILLMEDILHQLVGSLSHYSEGFLHPKWCRISFIHIPLRQHPPPWQRTVINGACHVDLCFVQRDLAVPLHSSFQQGHFWIFSAMTKTKATQMPEAVGI